MQLFDGQATRGDDQDHYFLLADGFVLVYEITSKASFDLVVTIKQKITSKNKEVCIPFLERGTVKLLPVDSPFFAGACDYGGQ